MSARDRARVLEDYILAHPDKKLIQSIVELLSLRLDRNKDSLVGTNCDLLRGRCQELRDLLKTFDQRIDN